MIKQLWENNKQIPKIELHPVDFFKKIKNLGGTSTSALWISRPCEPTYCTLQINIQVYEYSGYENYIFKEL